MEYLLAQLTNGLATGSVYALIALGYSLVFGVLQMHNLAHGDILMFGTFVGMSLLLAGVTPVAALLLPIAVGAAIGLMAERLAFRPTRDAHRMVPTVSAIGVALIIRNLAQQIWGTYTLPFPLKVDLQIYEAGGVIITNIQIIVFVAALLLMLITHLFVRSTLIGKAIRAVQQDREAAGFMGIPVNRVIAMVYALGGALGVAGGLLYAINYNTVFILMGFSVMLKGFISAVIGGIGSLQGAFIGGLVLGVIETLAAGYISSGYKDAIALGLLIVVLLVRPQGLLGVAAVNKV
jgi:branched-chain amino acid transport system permease protein